MIQKLAQQTNNLKRMGGKIGTSGDTPDFRATLEKNRSEAKQLCHTILERLRSNKGSDKQMFAKLSQNFEQALKAYEEVSKGIEHKQQGAIDRSSRGSSAAAAPSGRKPKRGAPNQKTSNDDDLESGNYRGGGGRAAAAADNDPNENLLSPNAAAAAQEQEEVQFTPYDVDQLETRRQDIAALERDVLDVAEMFKDLATMVDQQQEGIDTIADNITDAKQKAEEGAGQLDQAEDYQKSARKKKCCLVFLLLTVVGLVILGVVVLK